jgi:sugar transferase EpsL
MYRRHGKRLLDILITIPALIIFAPVLGLTALLVYFKLGSPVIFRQRRPGQHGTPFLMYKFRTMTDARDASGNLLPDAERLTPFGKWLRDTSLDELPELLNVLRGEMSLVGPRPFLLHYLEFYSAEQLRRLEALPGITGWPQVNGRNTLTWEQKFVLDLWYIDHLSLWLDLKILFMTIGKVLSREGISEPGQATVREFHRKTS